MNNIALISNDECKIPSDYTGHLISDIEKLAEGSCDNLYVGDMLDYIASENLDIVFTELLKKIKVEDGLMHIKAPDILQTCWYASRMNLETTKLRYILYHTKRKNCYSMEEMISTILSIPNSKIVNAHYVNGYEYSITVNKYED